MEQEDVIIKVDNLNLWYDKDKPIEVHALKDVSIQIKRGDYVAFFGPSGCGKTTMLYATTGIDSYQEGKVLINGKDLTGLSRKELAYFRQTDIGIVFQQFNLVASLTVLQNVALPMIFRGVSSSDAEVKARSLIERLNLGQYAKRFPFELSGGQQQRVAIARAIANDPPIIIADEPLGNLDSVNAKNVLAFLKELNEKDGRTIIMVTHEAWSLQDVKTIFYMKDGVITGEEKQTAGSGAEGALKHLTKEIGGGGKKDGGGEEMDRFTAHVIANFLLRGYSFEEIKRFEDILLDRINGKINDKEFYKEIHKPFDRGGVGLWKDKSQRVTDYVKNLIKNQKDISSIYQILEDNPELPIKDEIHKIRNWLLEDCKRTNFDHTQIESFDEAIEDRLRSNLSQDGFAKVISLPSSKFGVGFSYHTALSLAQKLEILLVDDLKTDKKEENDEVPVTKTEERDKKSKDNEVDEDEKKDFGKVAHKISTTKDFDVPVVDGHVLEKYIDDKSKIMSRLDKLIVSYFKDIKTAGGSTKEK